MRAFQLRHLLSSPRRRWQILLFGLILVILHLASSMLYKSQGAKVEKSDDQDILDILNLVESKTVSYNEVPDGLSAIGDDEVDTNEEAEGTNSDTSTTDNSNSDVVNKAFSFLDNPWYHEHDHDNAGDPLDLSPEDFDEDYVDQCKFRHMKNVTVFSRAEFIHEYLNFRKCQHANGESSSGPLDDWVKSKVKATAGSRGEMVIKTTFQFTFDNANFKCNGARLVILAFSKSIKERDIVRATWNKVIAQNATASQSAQLVFVVGKSLDEVSDSHSGDILQTHIGQVRH